MAMATIVPTSDPIEAKPGSNDSVWTMYSENELYPNVTRFIATRRPRNLEMSSRRMRNPPTKPDQPYREVNQPQGCSEGVDGEVGERAAAEYHQPTDKEL